MEFLGYSQTFIGVLASLLVLCIVLDKSNFIFNILNNIKEQIKNEIAELDRDTGFNNIDDISSGFGYTYLEEYIVNLKNKIQGGGDEEDKTLLENALAMEIKIRTAFNQLKSRKSIEVLKPADELIQSIGCANEQIIAPLYALFCCIIVFMCDELVVYFPTTCDYIVTFLSIFFLTSIIFWLLVWYNFLQNIQFRKISTKQDTKSRLKNLHINWIWLALGCVVISSLCWYISVYISMMWLKCLLVIGLGIIFPIMLVAIIKFLNHYESKSFSYVTCIKHFLMFAFLSLLLTGVMCCFTSIFDSASESCLIYQNFYPIKILILSFILLFGIVFPLVMPFIGYKYIPKFVMLRLGENNKSMQEELKILKSELENFCLKILKK